MENLIRELLVQLGENPDREGLVDTPARVARSLQFLTSGYHVDPYEVARSAIFHEECNHMVIVRDIEVYSMCEHHMLPFFGRCHIGYIPKGEVFGVSKLCRIVECFSRRLQLQERLTQQVARLIADSIHPEGVGVVMEAKHLCMMMRGVEKQDSCMVTSAMLGSFHDSHATRNEFLQLINRPSVA
jgi:GTP cyclohydrolase I